jgi:hypothetical protein
MTIGRAPDRQSRQAIREANEAAQKLILPGDGEDDSTPGEAPEDFQADSHERAQSVADAPRVTIWRTGCWPDGLRVLCR